MNSLLNLCVDETTPKLSDAINGYAPMVMREIPNFLNTRFAANIKIIDERIPLRYEGYRYMSPEEEYRAGLSKNTKTTIDIAESSLYMVEFKFSYDGQPINKQVLLPYSEHGNLMKISNTTYTISPVVSDRVFTPSDDSIFAKLAITKINFNSAIHNIRINGVKTPMQVIYSNEIIRIKVNGDNIGKPVPPIALYLLSKYGLRETLKKYFNCDLDVIKMVYGDVSEEDKEKYVIFQSCKERPRSHRDTTYLGHDAKILVKKDLSDDTGVINVITSIIYALDMLPESGSDAVDVFNEIEEVGSIRIYDNEKEFWLLLLGRLVFKDVWSPARIITDMRKNLSALDYYLDDYSKSIARYKMEDFFDMIRLLLENYNKWIIQHKEFNGSLDNKFVDMISYLAHDISYAYTKTLLNINKRFSKSSNGVSFKEVSKIFQELSAKKIFTLVKSNATNLCLTVSDYSGDLIYTKGTSILENQSRGNGVNRGPKSQFPKSIREVKAEDLITGSVLNLGKKNPSPSLKLNIFREYNPMTGEFILDDLDREVNKSINKDLLGHIDTRNMDMEKIEGLQMAAVADGDDYN